MLFVLYASIASMQVFFNSHVQFYIRKLFIITMILFSRMLDNYESKNLILLSLTKDDIDFSIKVCVTTRCV